MIPLYAANVLFLAVHGAYFFLPVYLTGLGASEAAVGAVMAAMGVSNAAALAGLYWVGERLDTRRLMLAGCAASGASCLGMLAVTGLGGIAALRMLQGVGFCLYFVSANAWIAQSCPPQERAKHLGYLGVVTLLTQAVAPAGAELLSTLAGFPALFAATAVLVAASAFWLTRVPPIGVPAQADSALVPGRGTTRAALRLGTVALLGGAGYGAVLLFSPLLLRSRGIVPLSLFFTAYALAAAGVRIVGRNWASRWGNLRLARWCFLLLGGATLLLAQSRTALSFAGASALFGVGHGLMYPAVAAHAVGALPGGSVRALTLWAGGFMIGVSLGAYLAGEVAERHTVAAAVGWAAVLPLLAWALLGPLPGRRSA
ncbi:MAG: MFS transporter [Thermodesulfobacteriota bacterium]